MNTACDLEWLIESSKMIRWAHTALQFSVLSKT